MGYGLGVALGAGLKRRPHAQIIRSGRFCPKRLLHIVRGNAQYPIGAQNLPGTHCLQIVLAHVYAVCTGGDGDIRTVVDDADYALFPADRRKGARLPKQLPIPDVFLP